MPAEERNEEARESSFDELAKGLASGTISRSRALRLAGASLLGVLLGGLPMRLAGTQTTCPYNYASCGSGRYCCGGNCVDLSTSNTNCGYCGNACPSGQTCQGGRCSSGGCPSGQQRCTTSTSSYCANLQTDRNNCGFCGNVCPSGQNCVGGQCGCPSGTTLCGGNCVSNECPSGQQFNPDTCRCEEEPSTCPPEDVCGEQCCNQLQDCFCYTRVDGGGVVCARFPTEGCTGGPCNSDEDCSHSPGWVCVIEPGCESESAGTCLGTCSGG
jgi:hypothetical protein